METGMPTRAPMGPIGPARPINEQERNPTKEPFHPIGTPRSILGSFKKGTEPSEYEKANVSLHNLAMESE